MITRISVDFLIRSSKSSATILRSTTTSATAPTTVLPITLKNMGHIKRKFYRFPKPHLRIPVASFSSKIDASFRDNSDHQNHDDRQNRNRQCKERQFLKGQNPGLASVISQGIKSLEQTAEEIQYKTRKRTLAQPHRKPTYRNGRSDQMDPRQLAEGQRILDTASDCLEQLALQEEQNGKRRSDVRDSKGLVIFGEPIVLLECEVNRNIRQAKIYWTLPYGILLDDRINQRLYQEIMINVQKKLVENGGAKQLARDVHTRLSYYYPPRIKLFPATDEMVQSAIREFMA